jgi:predicted nucleic-acid-binding Zn-ribbon protein
MSNEDSREENERETKRQPSRPDDETFTNACCYNCGGAEFTWGDVPVYDSNTGGQTPVRFRPDQERPAFWQGWKTEALRARRCNQCGNVQFFSTDFIGQ